MNVYFDENFWGCSLERSGKTPGKAIRAEKKFIWDKRVWRIPFFYVCEEGVVLDFCVRIPAEEIEAFLGKWKPLKETLSNEEQLCLERENPFSEDAGKAIWINGKKADEWSGCGASWIPPYLRAESEEKPAAGVEEELMEAYQCDCRDGWRFERLSVSWPKEAEKSVHSLTVQLKKAPVCYSGPHFRTAIGEGKKQVEFIHPVSGTEHILTVQRLERETVPESGMPGLKRMPTHLLAMYYTVEPKLAPQELRIADCEESDPPELEKRTGTSGVSVIGGGSGPVAVFWVGKKEAGEEQKEWKSAYSALHYEPRDTVEWRMEFYAESGEQTEISIK